MPLYPPESHHGVDVEVLAQPNFIFAVARDEKDAAVGCGAVVLSEEFGELKRMFVYPEVRGQGIARAILAFLESEAFSRGCNVLKLETGVRQAQAVAFYKRAGYVQCSHFGQYAPDPLSVFMSKSNESRLA